jgi:AraC-like DNA-binding protein
MEGTSAEDFLSRVNNLENIPAGELIWILEKTAREICKSNSKLLQNRPERQLTDKLKKYIEENFRNPDTNISITAYHFNMNPAYLSTVFREETGISLLEFINTLRIEEGKRLLRSGKEVIETAELCGFRGSGAFIRVFKKLTGLTPGQYQEMNI